MKEQEKKALAKAFEGIVAESRKQPPKARSVKCGLCRNRQPQTLKCTKYPNGIPKEILKESCPMFKQK